MFMFVSQFHKVRGDWKSVFRTVFTYEILFLVIKFVVKKINLTWHNTKLNIVIFCCVFELTGWDVCFSVTLTFYPVPQHHQAKACNKSLLAEPPKYTMKITFWKFPLDFPFIIYLLNSNYEKLAKHNPAFLQEKFFSILLKYWKVSKYKVMLSEFIFPKKRKKISLILGW